MRKAAPDDVRTAFVGQLDELLDYFSRMEDLVAGSSHEKGDLSRLAETVFLAASVAFERFCNDLFLAYMNRDFAAYQDDLAVRIGESVKERYGKWSADKVSFDPVPHLTLAGVADVVAGTGQNLSFSSSAKLKQKAESWLSPSQRKGIMGMSPDDDALIDATKSIRNFLAHRSADAKKTMNQALHKVTAQAPAKKGLGRGSKRVLDVGVYLKASKGGTKRVVTYLTRLKTVAGAM